ncbi:MAG: orotate phosphoribosyltransferase [Gammaproteobacteria bacterium]|nr:orotate phosphoribosyltransferase [Gammaproteobacteria bacterium]
MSNKALITELYQIGAIQFGEFVLKSGETSPLYINLRKIISYPELLEKVAHLIWLRAKNFSADLICGVPYTALPIATCISLKQKIPMVMRRKEKKDYGTKQMVEGEYRSGQSCLLIEDIITTGGSILETAEVLKTSGLIITGAIALIDRQQGGIANLTAHFPAESVLKLTDILTTLLAEKIVSPVERAIVEDLIQTRSAS